ncbi:MAG: hypothetical protein H6710_12180 [Myxococcales bacterium]|nr:hypothetical protein [Myxococcales bacterium]MCB9700392.1 hypothetical protein [Myxococcales bacterium]
MFGSPAAALLVSMAIAGCYAGTARQDTDDGEGSGESGASSSGADSGGDTDGADDGVPFGGPPDCVDTKSYFEEEVFRPILQAKCFACHNENGAAKATDFLLQGDDYPGYLDVNYNTFANIARLEIDGKPLVLRKPTLDGVMHEGGQRFEVDSPEYRTLETMIDLLDAPVHCQVDKDIEAYFAGLVLLDEKQTLRKATTLLANRLPTAEEIQMVEDEAMDGLDKALDAIMQEEAFYARIKDIYNDRLLTDAYLPGRKALDILDPMRYPAAKNLFAQDAQKRGWANDAVAREPLNIIENVLRKPNTPFSEIVTGDYTMVNPYSAQAYGLDPAELGFKDPADRNEYVEVNFEDIPQAGVLTTTAYLNRFPNTATNRNRARSRYLFDFFLGEDVLQLAARPINIDNVQGTNPTLFDASCNVCHDYIDPVAGAFQNYTFEGWYRPEAAWYGDMVPPGFNEETIDGEEDQQRALQWLAERVVKDDGFGLAVVYTLYEGLTGSPPLRQPLDVNDPDYLSKVRAFEAQDYTFKKLAQAFRAGNYEFRTLVKELIKTPWVRAINVEGELSDDRATELAPMGSSRALPPEILDRKIIAAVGFQWTRNGTSALSDENNYRFFYGGIDSINVTTRLKEINGVMNNIVERMANEVACRATAPDLSLPQEDRLLFPHVELYDEPGQADAKIRKNIQHLHARILGEHLEIDDPEITRTFDLFKAVLDEGRTGLESTAYQVTLPTPCQGNTNPITGEVIDDGIVEDADYKVRAWMAVLTYLLGDYEFLYE